MVRYRIYTEAVNEHTTLKLVEDFLPSATVYFGKGMFQKEWEHALIIEYIGNSQEADVKRVAKLARAIKIQNHQQVILLTTDEVAVQWITGDEAIDPLLEAYEKENKSI